jgi:phage minor structural protein
MPENTWYIGENGIYNTEFIDLPEKYMSKPYPMALWRIDPTRNNGLPFNELLPDIRGIDLWALEREHQIHVYDMHEPQSGFDGNGLAILDPISCTSLHNDERWEIELNHPLDEWGKWKNLLVGNYLKVDGQIFRIDISQPELSGSERKMYVHARHITQDMTDMLLEKGTFQGGTAQTFIDFCFTNYKRVGVPGYEYYQFEGYSDIDTVRDVSEYVNTSVWAAMIGADNSLINRYGGELYRDNFYFSINSRMQYAKDNAFYLRYSLDMVKITQRVDYTDFCTNLICYDNYGNKWSVSDSSSWARTRVHHPIVRMAQFNYPEYEGAFQQLMIDGYNLWLRVSVPKITYDVQIAALKNDPRYAEFLNLQNYNYGDSGTIYCPELDISTEQKITEIEKNELTGEITRMILGNLRCAVTRPTYMGSTISSGHSIEDKQSKAIQDQMYELAFDTLILTPITTSDGEYLTTSDGKYIQYRSDD